MSHTFAAFLEHDSLPSPVTGPAKVVHRDYITHSQPSEYELDSLQWGHKLNGPVSITQTPLTTNPPTPGELESSNPPTPARETAVDALIMSASSPKINKWRLLGAGLQFTLMGLSDAATGALIPYIEVHYDIGYAIVSLVFVANALGFILAAPFVQAIDKRLGRAKALILVDVLMAMGYTALVCQPPFPLVVVAFFFLGLGSAIFLSITNLFCLSLLNGTVILGVMHGLYGVGGILAPLMATAIVSNGGAWSLYYAIPLGMAVLALVTMGWSFRGFEQDAGTQLLTALEKTASRIAAAELGEPTNFQLLKRALSKRTTLLGALFILFYQGGEVAVSGWVISFLIKYRDGNPAKVGNVTSGFWAGITLGRLVLTHFAHKFGERLSVGILVIVAAAFQLMVWLIPNVIGNAVAEAIVGLALGPVYPCATAVFSRLLPKSLQVPALSFVTSMGSSGGALIPLITGLMAQRLGTVVLHPIFLFSCAMMTVAWLLLPRVVKRTE